MSYTPCRERTFPLRLAQEFEYHYYGYLHWLKHLLERLGRECTLAVWQGAFADFDAAPLSDILSADWGPSDADEAADADDVIASLLEEVFPLPVEGVSPEEARDIIDGTPPFPQIRQRFSDLNVTRETTTYEALHLFRDGLALLAETLIDRHGKQGEFIAYDAMLAELAAAGIPGQEVADFMAKRQARFGSEPDEADMFTAGLEVEFIRGSENEVVTLVKECEWARYFRERHPRVGYLLACGLDNAMYGAFNERIRLQRTSTLMEGGSACDFRVYAVDPAPEPVVEVRGI
jgi:hypothetical protein